MCFNGVWCGRRMRNTSSPQMLCPLLVAGAVADVTVEQDVM